MAEESKPVETMSEPKTEVMASTATPVAQKKSGSALPKVIIILVVVLCLCGLCAGAAWFAFARFAGAATDSLNSAVTNSLINAAYNASGTTGSSNSTGTSNSSGSSANFTYGTSLPSTFPTDVPIYSGATASFSSSDVNSDGKAETSVTFALKGTSADVVNFYKAQMGSNGYSLSSEVNFFGNVMTFDNAQREVIVSVIGSSDANSDVVLSIISTNK